VRARRPRERRNENVYRVILLLLFVVVVVVVVDLSAFGLNDPTNVSRRLLPSRSSNDACLGCRNIGHVHYQFSGLFVHLRVAVRNDENLNLGRTENVTLCGTITDENINNDSNFDAGRPRGRPIKRSSVVGRRDNNNINDDNLFISCSCTRETAASAERLIGFPDDDDDDDKRTRFSRVNPITTN